MVALQTPQADIGLKAPDFTLRGVDGAMHSLASLRGKNGLLLIFMCNHCPYVQKQIERINHTAQLLKQLGFGVAAINANDAKEYPEDSYENMQIFARKQSFCFPYLYDETQATAAAYGAVCTPDFFGYNSELTLQYRGRMDSSWSGLEVSPKAELLIAMEEIAHQGYTSMAQQPSIGCSIKWRVSERESA